MAAVRRKVPQWKLDAVEEIKKVIQRIPYRSDSWIQRSSLFTVPENPKRFPQRGRYQSR